MKKILLLISLSFGLFAQDLLIKRDGKVIDFSVTKENTIYTLSNKKFFKDDVKVIVEYKKNVNKKLLENKYSLQNCEILYSNINICEQYSDNVISLFKDLSSEKDILNVYPNWTSRIKLR